MTTAAAPRPAPGAAARTVSRARQLVSTVVASVWRLGLLGVLAGVIAILFLHRGDPEESSRLANAEIEEVLERGETVVARVPVQQRRWWDYFRITHGVLSATDRRLLYIGVSPEEVLPREEEPREIIETSFPYDRPVTLSRRRVFLGTRSGVRLVNAAATETFGIDSRDRSKLDTVLVILERRRSEAAAALEAERLAAEAAAAAARRPIYHLVQRGEALDFLSRRYGVPVDSIMKWNNLTSTRIAAGKRLLVKPGT